MPARQKPRDRELSLNERGNGSIRGSLGHRLVRRHRKIRRNSPFEVTCVVLEDLRFGTLVNTRFLSKTSVDKSQQQNGDHDETHIKLLHVPKGIYGLAPKGIYGCTKGY